MITIEITANEDRSQSTRHCPHRPPCPAADAADGEAARIRTARPDQGWSLLCNGIITFDDAGALLPDGHVIAPHLAAHLVRA